MTKPTHTTNIKPSIAEAIEEGGFGGEKPSGTATSFSTSDTDYSPEFKELDDRIRGVPASDACNMDFGDAIRCMKRGDRVQRHGWNGKNMYLELQVPDAHSKMTLPYIFMFTADRHFVPWLASQTDMLASDWRVIG